VGMKYQRGIYIMNINLSPPKNIGVFGGSDALIVSLYIMMRRKYTKIQIKPLI